MCGSIALKMSKGSMYQRSGRAMGKRADHGAEVPLLLQTSYVARKNCKGLTRTSRFSCGAISYAGKLAPDIPEGPSGGLNKRPYFFVLAGWWDTLLVKATAGAFV